MARAGRQKGADDGKGASSGATSRKDCARKPTTEGATKAASPPAPQTRIYPDPFPGVSLYEQLFQRNSAVMLLVDAENGCIIEANPAAVAFYGHPAGCLCGMSIHQISTQSADAQSNRLKGLREGRLSRFVSEHRLATGELRNVEVHAVPVRLFERTLLYSIIHDITDRVRAQEALRSSEQHLDMVLEGAGIGCFDWHAESGVLTCDARWRLVHGVDDDTEISGMGAWLALVHPDDLPAQELARKRHLSGDTARYEAEYRVRGHDGAWNWVQESGRVVERDAAGNPLRVAGIVRDVSDRRRAEEDRRRLFRLSPDLMAVGGMDGYLREVNPAWQTVLGWSEEELLARSWVSLVHPDDLDRTAEGMERLVEQGVITNAENRYMCPDGSWRWISWNSALVHEHGLIYGVGRDVTEYRGMMEELREREARLRALAATVPGVVFKWREISGERRFTYVSPRSREVLGVPAEDLMHDWRMLPVHPDDRAMFELSLRDATERGGDWLFEGRLVLPGGEVRWWRGEAKPARAGSVEPAENDPLVYCGIITDTTEHREAQERLRQLATTDGLTGLANRRRFLEALGHEISRHQRYAIPLGLVSFDVDHFKHINDTWGHAVGDEVLRALAAICRAEVRVVDVVGRIGGEEFAVLLPDTAPEEAFAVAERLCRAVAREPVRTTAGNINVTVSVGVATTPPCSCADDLLREADRALYRAKREGRNRVERAQVLAGACGGMEADAGRFTIP